MFWGSGGPMAYFHEVGQVGQVDTNRFPTSSLFCFDGLGRHALTGILGGQELQKVQGGSLPQELFDILASECIIKIEQFTSQTLANIAGAWATVSLWRPSLMAAIGGGKRRHANQ
eukprot:5562975-Amphidinium_carterae.1